VGVIERGQENRRIVEFNIESTRKPAVALDADIAILADPKSSRSAIPQKLDYGWEPWDTRDGSWQAAKQNGSSSLMPHDELRRYVCRVYLTNNRGGVPRMLPFAIGSYESKAPVQTTRCAAQVLARDAGLSE
jgi:hypothetical protein